MHTISNPIALFKAMNRLFPCLVLLCGCIGTACAQHGEVEVDLRHIDVGSPARGALQTRGDMFFPIALPFVDDFAWPSMAHEEGPVNLKRWEPSPVRRTMTLAYQPPTVGCATLDGLNASGDPYALTPVDPAGYADTLTSRRLLLGEGYTSGDSVALSFWYQSGGIANGADAGEDSLVVEFRTSVAEGDPWRWVWSTEGIDDDTLFHPEVIHIDAPEFFHNDFQFRFRSYGSLEGNVDTWHLDYVRVDEDAMTTAPEFEEVAFVTPPTSFLIYPWTAMPWPHFEVAPSVYTATSVPTLHRSFGSTSNSQEDIGLKVQRVDVLGNVNSYAPAAGAVVNNSVQGLFGTDYVDDLQIFTDLFNPALSDSFAVFHVSLWEDEVGAANLTTQIGVPDNDSLVHVQTFRDYYAYDDGTAEKAYALEGQGGELVVRFDIQQPDTLDGVWMHFTPFFDDAVGETFTLKIRGEDPDFPGQPGEALQAQFEVQEPDYFTGEHDGFVYYAFNAPIAVDGPVFVGFVQQGEERIHVGLDKNTDTNADHLWYKFPTSPWQQSAIQGSLMIRPVLRAGKELVTDVSELGLERPRAIHVYPNPGRHEMTLDLSKAMSVSVLDMSGRLLDVMGLLAEGRHVWQAPYAGVFVVRGVDENGGVHTQRWIAKP